jgi:hypothetical protein
MIVDVVRTTFSGSAVNLHGQNIVLQSTCRPWRAGGGHKCPHECVLVRLLQDLRIVISCAVIVVFDSLDMNMPRRCLLDMGRQGRLTACHSIEGCKPVPHDAFIQP